MKRVIVLSCAALLVAGCGQRAPLKPAPGQALPVRPLMARTTPTPEELLAIPDIARPQRIDELVRRSEPRQPDRFDLPPPDGGAAPTIAGEGSPVTPDAETGTVQDR